ncbi:DUF438 domain-containing protein [Anoxybacterium hadale]|uniref:DUF438 domain-containing protein n=1 Tax=Anoxybacterium hadale TaxID=3408580 RepID=A0ACD1AFL1_9FIRM|nr:DUF438 domain-containing protein [Clostridiales bacterium]
MSELINNREFRVETIKKILAQLHEGKTVEEVKSQFAEAFEGVSAEEISQAEQALVNEGMAVEEIQNLCDVHAEVFKGSIEEIHRGEEPSELPSHPANVLKAENRALENLMGEIKTASSQVLPDLLKNLYQGLDIHYKKKENLFFPYMEQYGISAPPKVMWGVDDEIRTMLKNVLKTAENGSLAEELQSAISETFVKIADMIFKEENILLGILLENLTVDEWKQIGEDSGDFGYCLIESPGKWTPEEEPAAERARNASDAMKTQRNEAGLIQLPTGSFTVQELTTILDTLPIDITFVGKDDTVRYFSQSSERIFHRTPSVIGRQVSNCHPPASVHIVEKLVEDFKNGIKDSEDFWIHLGDKFVLIRYFAVRGQGGDYLGVLEVTQNIAPIQKITGDKRLVSE